MDTNKLKFWPTNFSQLFAALLIASAFGIAPVQAQLHNSPARVQTPQPQTQQQKAYASRGPIVLELFTSTKCPACPPADRNMEALFGRPDVIALSCHVTYFDRGQKKDPYSKPFCDARQSIYKMTLKTKQVFTPMIVLDGTDFVTGNDREDLKQALTRTGKEHVNKLISLNIRNQYMEIRLPPMNLKQDAEIWVIEYLPATAEGLSGAVTSMTKLMNWNGSAYTLGSPINRGRDYAVIAQDYKTGILASAKSGK